MIFTDMGYADRRLIFYNPELKDTTVLQCVFDELTDYDEIIMEESVREVKRAKRYFFMDALGFPFVFLFSIVFENSKETAMRWDAQKLQLKALFTPSNELARKLTDEKMYVR